MGIILLCGIGLIIEVRELLGLGFVLS